MQTTSSVPTTLSCRKPSSTCTYNSELDYMSKVVLKNSTCLVNFERLLDFLRQCCKVAFDIFGENVVHQFQPIRVEFVFGG